MRRILGFCAVLAVVHLALAVERVSAYQTPATGRTAPPSSAASQATNAVNNALQGTTAPGTVPNATQTPVVSGAATNVVPGATTGTANVLQGTTAPGTVPNATQTPVVPGTATNVVPGATTGTAGAYAPATQPATTTLAPGTVAPGSVNRQVIPNQAYSSYYVQGAQPAQTPVSPMAEIPYYNSFYGAGRVQPGRVTSGYYGYSSMYVAPGTGYGYPTAAPNYRPARRGLFGGLFGRRNRQVYATSPYGYTYGAAPYGYTTSVTPYSPGYVTAPGTYTYGMTPY
jgi:hypothetical protein